MRGLNIFLTDLRFCKDKNEEMKIINKELANIRSKFKGLKLLTGYQRRKYVCKLVYMFLLGYKFDFGSMEAVNLLSSNSYNEKEAGYLFLSVVKGDNCNVTPLVANAIKIDLSSHRDVFRNLALRFIANSTSLRLANSLADPVLKLLFSSDTVDIVRQSAVLALLQLLRIKSDVVLTEAKANELTNLISHRDFGIATAASSLIEFLVKTSPFKYHSCAEQCIIKLSKIVPQKRIVCRDYSYYFVVAPWLCVKLLRILQNFPAPSDAALKLRLESSLEIILRKVDDTPLRMLNNFEHNNAKYAVIFEAISLIMHMELKGYVLSKAFTILGKTLTRKSKNLRFMALDIMSRLSSNMMYLEHLKPQWETVLNVLKTEYDITLKKRTVNLLYFVCSAHNVKPIVHEMLNLLEKKDFFMEEVMLQIAAMAEQFCDDREWYIDTIFNLLQKCGHKISSSVWHTLVNIVVENDDVQEYAAQTSYAVLCEKNCHDVIIKLAGYILGEFGHLIASVPQSSYKLQFDKLKEKYYQCPSSVKGLLLTTFMKFFNKYPDVKHEVQLIFKEACDIKNGDVEIQQRAVEYLKLSEMPNSDLLATVLEHIPSRENNTSTTVAAFKTKKSQEMSAQRKESRYRKETSTTKRVEIPEEITIAESASHVDLPSATSGNINLLVGPLKDTPTENTVTETIISMPGLEIEIIPNNVSFLHHLLFNEKATLYEDDLILIFIEGEFNRHLGKFHLKYLNKTSTDFSEFSILGDFTSIEDKCSVSFKPCNSTLRTEEIMEQCLQLECLNVFSERPFLNLKFVSESKYNEVKLIMPLTLNKFVQPGDMTADLFNERWQKFEPQTQEVVKEFIAKCPMIYGVTRQKLESFRLAVIENVNSDSDNIYCAGIVCMRERQIGFLVQLERYILYTKYCCRVRSSRNNLSHVISNLLCELL